MVATSNKSRPEMAIECEAHFGFSEVVAYDGSVFSTELKDFLSPLLGGVPDLRSIYIYTLW